MSEGDIIVLHVGTANVYGVGEVVEGYIWSESLGDIDGWSQVHVRRVRWLWQYKDRPKNFPAYTLK